MGSRTLTNVVTPSTIALNAFIYGYAGHSLQTPHSRLQQLWWTEDRIHTKVTKEFILSRLRPQDRERMLQPLAFADGLTDDTYIEWVLERARRLFLTLSEIGAPEQIFALIDDSGDDDDLPLPLDQIESLSLSYNSNGQLNRKFFQAQYTFLLRELQQGMHIEYGQNESIPLELLHEIPPAASLQNWFRVHLPSKPDNLLVRRKYNLDGEASTPTKVTPDEFLRGVTSSRMVEHDHIAPVWASFTSKASAYTLTTFVSRHTLRSFIDQRSPAQYSKLSSHEQHVLPLTWLHCLAEAVSAMHQAGVYHTAIRPSNIVIDEKNTIAFSDIGSLSSLQKDKRPDPLETYVYGPPEAHSSILALLIQTDLAPTSPVGTGRGARIQSTSTTSSNNSSNHSTSSASARNSTVSLKASKLAPMDFGFHKKANANPISPSAAATEKADIFSLGCVFLDIMTFLLRKKPSEFTKHRSTKQKDATTKSTRIDSSFHANLDCIDSWMQVLEIIPIKNDSGICRGIPYLLTLIRSMLNANPDMRPSAFDVSNRLSNILINHSGIEKLHCGHNNDQLVSIAPTIHGGIGMAISEDPEEDEYAISPMEHLRPITSISSSRSSRSISPTRKLSHVPSKMSLFSRWKRPIVLYP